MVVYKTQKCQPLYCAIAGSIRPLSCGCIKLKLSLSSGRVSRLPTYSRIVSARHVREPPSGRSD